MAKSKEYGCIYKHTNLIHEGWSYIGQTCQTLGNRWKINGHGYEKGYAFRRAIEKYGWENFSHEIIEDNIPLDKLDEREMYWIAYYHTYVGDPECKGYNLTVGGRSSRGRIATEETRKKTSKTLKGHELSKDTIRKIGEKKKGDKHTEETKKIIGEANKGRDRTPQPVMCVETQMVFRSLDQAAKYYGHKSPWVKNRIDNPSYFKDDPHFVRINEHD